MKTRSMAVLLSMGLAFSLSACSGGSVEADTGSAGGAPAVAEKTGPAKDEVKAEEIAWTASDVVIDGKRRVAIQYENKSAYTIANLRIDFVVREDLSEEELQAAFSDMQSEINADPADNAKKNGMWGEVSIPVLSGESSEPGPLEVGAIYINDMAQFEAVEPDLMKIAFLTDDGKMYEETYDFKNDSYSLNSKVIDTAEWGSEEPATMSPKIDGAIVVDVEDAADRFSFEAIDVDQGEFDAYVDACKEAGFTVDPAETDQTYYADHVDGGFHVDCFYYPGRQQLTIYLDRLQ